MKKIPKKIESGLDAVVLLQKLPADSEVAHTRADEILLAVLRGNGLADVADAYESAREDIDFWYA